MTRRLEPGSVIAERYRIDAPLGHGAMGQVFQGLDLTLQRSVAIKVIHLDARLEGDLRGRFQTEAVAAARIRNPHVVTIYDVGTDQDDAYIVQDLLFGPTLADVIAERGALPAGFSVLVVAQICEALAAIHAARLVHRDVKPSNIILTTTPFGTAHAVLIDFGVAKVLRAEFSLPETGRGIVIGTPAYMSPEQAAALPIDERTDLHALGSVLFEMIAGERLFTGASPLDVLVRVMKQSRDDLALPPGRASDALVAVLRRSLALEASDRYPSATAMRDALLATPEGRSPSPVLPPRPVSVEEHAVLERADTLIPVDTGSFDAGSGPAPPSVPDDDEAATMWKSPGPPAPPGGLRAHHTMYGWPPSSTPKGIELGGYGAPPPMRHESLPTQTAILAPPSRGDDLGRYLAQAGFDVDASSAPLIRAVRRPGSPLPDVDLFAIVVEPDEPASPVQTMATVAFRAGAGPLYALRGKPGRPHHVLAVLRSPPGAGVYREWHDLATTRDVIVSPVSPLALRAAVDARSAAVHLAQILGRAHEDPFELEGRITSEIDFFGGSLELQLFLAQVKAGGPGMGLFGLERSGTTSLLLRFQAEIGDGASAFVDLAALADLSLASLLGAASDRLAASLGRPAPSRAFDEAGAAAALRALVEDCHAAGRGCPVIFLDRVDELTRGGRASPDVLIAVTRALYQLVFPATGRGRAMLVLGGREDQLLSAPSFGAQQNPLAGALLARYARFFGRDELGELYARLGARGGLLFLDEAIDEAFQLTGGHKYLARRLGSALHQRRADGAAGPAITRADVGACAFPLVTRHHPYFEGLVRAPRGLREVLARIAAGPLPVTELLGLAAGLRRPAGSYLAALKAASDYRLVVERDGRYRITIGLLSQWLLLTAGDGPASIAPEITRQPAAPSDAQIRGLERILREAYASQNELELLVHEIGARFTDAVRHGLPFTNQVIDLVGWAARNGRFWDLEQVVRRERAAYFQPSEASADVAATGLFRPGRG